MSEEIDIASLVIPAGFSGFFGVVVTLLGAVEWYRGGEPGATLVGLVALAVSAGLYRYIAYRTRLLRIKDRLRGKPWPPEVPENRTVRM